MQYFELNDGILIYRTLVNETIELLKEKKENKRGLMKEVKLIQAFEVPANSYFSIGFLNNEH